MRKIYLAMLMVGCAITGAVTDAQAQNVMVAATAGTTAANYTTLEAAIAAVNIGTHQGNITISLNTATLSPAAPIVINSTGFNNGTGTANYASINIRPIIDNVTINGTTVTTGRGVIELNGADNVTIDGDNPNTGGTNRNLNIGFTTTSTNAYTSVIRVQTSAFTNIISCNGNTVKNCTLTGSSASGNTTGNTSTTAHYASTFGILVGGGGSTATGGSPSAIGAVVTTTGTGSTVNGLTLSNNVINQCSRGIAFNGHASTAINLLTITNNTIGAAATLTGAGPYTTPATTVYTKGIYVQGATAATITGNTIRNIMSYVATPISGIEINSLMGAGVLNVSNNTITGVAYNNTAAQPTRGISILNAGAPYTVSGNTISKVASAFASTTKANRAAGIYVATTATSATIASNKIDGVYSTNANTYGVAGIYLNGGNAITVQNNFVTDINENIVGGVAFGTQYGIYGIQVSVGTAHKIYHNTVYLTGATIGTASELSIYAFSIDGTGQTSMDVRNNIFVNNMTGPTTLSAITAVALPSGANSSMNLTMNHNALYCGTTTSNQGIAQVGTTSSAATLYLPSDFNASATTPTTNLRAYTSTLSAAGTNDNNTIVSTTLPLFVSTTSPYLQVDAANAPLVSGATGTGVTTDINGTTRSGTTPVRGGHEVVLPAACSSMPTAGTAGASPTTGCGDYTTTLSATGVTSALALTYQWQTSPDNIAAYTDIALATNNTYVATVTAAAYYRLAVKCTVTNETAFSVPVQVTRTALPVISGGNSVCISSTLSLAGAPSGGTWASSNGAVATVNASGVVSGLTYGTTTITYTDLGGCKNTQVVSSNVTPSAIAFSPGTTSTICLNASTTFTATATTPSISVFKEEFNAVPVGWTVDNTGSTVPASTTWALYANNTTVATLFHTTPDASGFAASSSDAGGSGSTTQSRLISPTFSLAGYSTASMSLQHYYHYISSDVAASVEISIDGGVNWITVKNYRTDAVIVGGPTAFATGTLNLTPYVGNANCKIRFFYSAGWGYDWSINRFEITATPSVTYAWAGISGADGLACTACQSNTITPTTSGTKVYSVIATSGGCSSSPSNVTVNVTPLTAPIGGTLSACIGATSQLTNAMSPGVWESNPSSVASISSTGLVTAGASAGTAVITYTATGYCAATATFAVNGSPAPIVGPTTVCTGSNITLTNPGGVGAWTSSIPASGTVGASTGVVTGVAVGTTAISYSNGCGTPAGTVVTVLQSGDVSGDAITCVGSNTTLTAATAGTWASTNTAAATISSLGVVTPVAQGVTTINFTPTNGCAVVMRVQTVNSSPSAVSITPSTSASICLGASTTFTATATPPSINIITENFNGTFTGWTIENTSTGSSPANQGWHQAADGFTSANYATYFAGTSGIMHSPDNSSFLHSNPDVGGSGSSTVTKFTSPVFSIPGGMNSASLTFQHWYAYWASGDATVKVELSTDGGATYPILLRNQLGTSAGAINAFLSESISLNSYIGMSNLRVRFNFSSVWGYGWAVDNVAVVAVGATPTYAWTGVSGATGLACSACSANTMTPTGSGANVYSVVATSGGCSTSNTATVNIPAVNVYTVTGGGSYCAGGSGVSIGLNGSQNGYSYALKNSGGTTVDTKVGTGGTITFADQTAASTYTVVATSSSPACNANMDGSATVSINTLPPTTTVTASPATVACYAATLTATNGSVGTMYYQGTSATASLTATPATTVNVTSSGTYYFRAQSSAGCWGAAGSVAVTINTCVDVSNFATIAANACKSTATTVTVNSSTLAAGTYTVTYSLSGANTLASATATITMAGGTGTFSIPGTSLSGTGSTTINISAVTDATSYSSSPASPGNTSSFTVHTLPADVTASGAGTFCGSTSISGSNGSDGTIYFQGTTSNGTDIGSGGSPQTISTLGTNTYYFRARSSDGCWSNPGSVAVTITTIPTAAPTNNGPICNGGTVTLNANPANGASTYSWSGPGFSSTSQNPTATPTATGIYSLTVTNGTANPGCSPSTIYTTQVTVNAKPIATVGNNGPICNGGTVTLTATPGGSTTNYSWTGPSFASSAQNPTATPTSTTTYSLTVTNGTSASGCTPSDIYTTTVTVRSKPTAAPTNNGYICNGGTVTLTANPANGANTYNWLGTSLSSATAQNPTATPTSTTIYTLTVSDGTTDNGCSPTTQYTTSVTVNSKPTATVGNNGPICAGGTVTLTATPSGGASTYSWSGSSLSSAVAQNPTATPTSTSIYSLTVTDGSSQPGCSPTDVYTTSVTVKSKPTAAPTNNGYICNGGTANLTANPVGGATVFAWSGTPISLASAENPTANPTSTTTYSLTVSDGTSDNGCSPSDIYTTTVTVNAKPTAAPTNNGYICNGGTVTLTANPAGGANTYAWLGSSLSSASAQNPTATPTATTIYSLTVSDGSGKPGCAPSDIYTTSVTVNDKPTATVGNNGPICAGGTVTLTATPAGGASTYSWSGSSLSSAVAQDPTATPTTTSIYSLTVTDGSTQPGCSPTDVYTTSVTVKSKPTAAPTNNGYICNGGTANLTANPAGGATVFAWSGTPISLASAENPTANPTSTTTYSLTVSDGTSDNGCSPSDIYTTTVTVNDKPTAAPTNNGYICNGGTVTLTANPAGGANTYAWLGTSLSSATAQNPTATPTATTIYSLTVSDGSGKPGCAPSDIYTTSVTVNDKPTATVGNNGPICAGGTVTLTATPAGGASTYNWSGSSLSSAVAQDPTATPTITSIYSLTVTDGSTQPGCSPTDVYTTSVTVKSKPTAAPTNNGYICNGGTANLTANPSGGATVFAWTGSPISSGSAENPTANPTSTTTYSLTVSDGTGDNGCAPSDIYTTTVTVNDKPVAAPVNSGILCNGGTVTLNAMPSGGANTYAWTGTSLSSGSAQNPTATPTTGTHIYTLTVSDGSGKPGCSPTDMYTTTVTVNPAPALASVTNNGPVCEGTTLTFSANGATDVTGYSWAGPVALTGGTTATPSVPGSTTAATGTYTVTVNNGTGSGCAIPYTNAAVVHVVPSVASITPSTTNICVGSAITFTAGAVSGTGSLTSYNWTGPNGFNTTTSSGSTSFTTTSTAQSGVYSLSVTYPGGGCSSPQAVTTAVTVSALPTMVNMGASPAVLCAGATLTLTGNGAFGVGSLISYNWSGPNGYSSTSTSSAQLYVPATAAASGNYSVTVTYPGTGCTSNPVASSAVTVNPLPTIYDVNGGGFYCSGGTGVNVELSDSDPGISYQLYFGSTADGTPMAGTGNLLDYGMKTAAGTYSVLATDNLTSCAIPMNGTVNVTVGPVPVAYTMTGGGGYCAGGAGVPVTLSNGDVGVGYQLYRDGVAVGSIISPSVSGPFSFGTYTATGVYTAIANPSATCSKPMNGSVNVSINPLPNPYVVGGGGHYCAGGTGVHITQDFSVVGINYQLYLGTSTVGSPVAGASSGLDFGLQTADGTYSVRATNTTTGCINGMSGTPTITIDPLPTVFTVGGGGSYCSGLSGLSVTLSGTTSGVNYQVYNGTTAVGSPVGGNGSAMTLGTFTAAGTYTVRATNTTTTCVNGMSGSAVISINPLPTAYAMTGGGAYCQGGTGVHVGIANSDLGTDYALYNAGAHIMTMPGANSGLDFGLITTAGTYTILATNTATGCINPMSGSATVSVNPIPQLHNVTGGGTTCANGGGLAIGLDGSNASISYQLYSGATAIGSPVAGNTLAISFGNFNTAGTYSVLATHTGNSCTRGMTGTAAININPAPTAWTVMGGGGYCTGTSGAAIGLAHSELNVQYQLYNGAAIASGVFPGDGNPINFGTYTATGTYSVLATNIATFCTNAMSNSVVVSVNALPATYTVTGGGTYCSGGTGVNVGLSNSATGVNYQLYRGSTADGSAVSGTGSSINFGLKTSTGTYSVLATNATTGCTNGMTGTVNITISASPAVHTVTGGGNYCTGSTGSVIGLDGSNVGINYRLYMGSTPMGAIVTGTGAAISMSPQTTVGTYSIIATDAGSSCTAVMNGTATVGVLTSPSAFSVSGGGHYCAGGSGQAVGLIGSTSGVNYQLYRGATAVGSPVAGTGMSISFGSQTVAGTYTVQATDGGNSCTAAMTGSAAIVVDPLPAAHTVTGGGQYCQGGTGVSIGLSFGNSGVNYQLYNGATAVGSPVAGSSATLSFGIQTTAGTYTVLATDAVTGCTNAMTSSATVVVNPLPTVQTVTGGGSFCSDASGVAVNLSGSQTGVNYQLYVNGTATGMPIGGTGSGFSFGNQTTAGTYTVLATNATTSCVRNMSSSANVVVNPTPTAYTVTGGGTLCTGQAGYAIGLSGSQVNVQYTLYNGSTVTGIVMNGTGSTLNFGTFTTAGIYTVSAVNTGTGCTKPMTGGANIVVNPLPNAQTVTGGGQFCTGGTGVAVGLGGTQTGINYTLYRGALNTGSTMTGTGASISFGMQTTAGTYSVLATNATTGCTRGMTGTAGVTVNALPAVQTVTGGGSFCAGGAGVNIGLSGSQSGVAYQLYSGSATYGSAAPGTGSTLSFGAVDVAGTYTVGATNYTTGCVNDMSGSATVIVNALPTAYTVSGGGSYCSGGTGVAVTLSGSQSGITYQLYNGSVTSGSAVSGTGAALTFNGNTVAGTYSVLATNTATGCTRGMTNTTAVSILPLPTVHTVTGGGTYCIGGTGVNIGLTSSNIGVNYQLYNGATAVGTPFTGSGMTFDFGLQTALGTYTVLATNIFSGCTIAMNGSTTISTNPLPVAQTVTGGGTYCSGGAGMAVGLGSTEANISYQLYRGATITGTPVTGTGSAISFGLQGTAGTYSVLATNTSTGCTKAMTGTAVIVVNPTPVAQTVTGGGNYCAGGTGMAVGLNSSVSGTTYQLYYGSTTTGAAVAGTGAAISFGNMTSVGTYSVRATITATGCTAGMTGTATVNTNALPTLYTVTGGGSYCTGGAGVAVGLSGSTNGVNYALYNGATLVTTAPGNGSTLSFGLQAAAGNYSVVATNATTACTRNMTGAASVSINALPVVQAVTGGGSYCAGGAGVHVGLASTEGGVNYQLYRNGAAVGSLTAGTGTTLDLGTMTIAGTYSVSAVNASTGCANNMGGTAVVSINALPNINNVTGGGSYCTGGTGVAVGLGNTQTGVSYQLYNGSATSGSAVAGTGNAISFGLRTAAGTYSVVATDLSTTCVAAMSGTATISINPLPNAFSVSGGGAYCAGGTGVSVSLSGSGNSISYQLYNGAAATGSPVTGTGGAISFGMQTAAGTYSVLATNTGTGCTKGMTGTATVAVNTPPAAFTMTGGGAYCAGGTGVHVGLAASATGINYQLYYGATATGSPVAGTGGALDLGLKTAVGTYSVAAVNATTGCAAAMTGTATISVNALPLAQTVTGGGAYCAGGTGVFVMMPASENGISYQLYNGAAAAGTAMTGTGGAVSFGQQAMAGTYSVVATNTNTGCTKAMSGTATVVVNALPAVFNMTGGGSYCAGGTGVAIGLSGSTAGVSYKLYLGTTFVNTTTGTGSALNFGMKTSVGDYNVVATSAAGCTQPMAGASTVVMNAAPVAYTVTGGGNYCTGGNGVNVGLSGSTIGVNYQLYHGSTTSGSPMAGTGGDIDFGLKTAAGTYSVAAVTATTGCNRSMTGTVSININTLPAVQTVTGGGSFCAGGAGVTVALGGSQTGVNYQLYNGMNTSGTAVAGTGAGISFGMRTDAGTYSVKATNATTGCVMNMTGSATVSINELPTAHTMTGGGDICTGAAGVAVGLNSSNTGINYRLYNGTAAVGGTVAGTGNALSFGTFTTAGTYTVQATNSTTGCTSGMGGVATVVVNPLPAVYSMTGGGNFCAGGTGVSVGMTGSQAGVNYHLYNGAGVVATTAGTGSTLNFGLQTAGGVYTVVAENAMTGCTRNMSGSSTVTITALPTAFAVTGGGAYCAGSGGAAIGLEGSQAGVSYQLYLGASASGTAVAGNGLAISLGNRTTDGTYTVKATNTNGCVNMMTGNAQVTTNALPAAHTVTGGGNYCAGGTGVAIGLESSDMNVSYTLYLGTTAVAGPVTSAGGMFSFAPQMSAGNYTVKATGATTGCSNTMTGTAMITIDALPTAQAVTASATSYCAGGTGVSISLGGSQAGVTYMLYNGAAQVASVTGTGVAVSFGNMTATGTYTAKAVNNTTGCMNTMTGSANISIDPLPATFPVTGGGAVCAGGAGVAVGLAGSQAGINYILKMGSTTVGTAVAGTGDAISFGLRTNAGTYTVMAINAASGCSRAMGGNAVINVNALPNAFTVTGGGSYCSGGAGMPVGLSGSQPDIAYQLYKDGSATGLPVTGTGNALDLGAMTDAGTYSVMATNTMTTCTRAMTGNTAISVNALPDAVNVTGGGSLCAGGTGVTVGISGSATGISYRLYRGSALVATASGTGSGMNFGTYTVAGTYTVTAVNTTTGCTANMNGTATISVNALPTAQTVTGGGSYCAGGTGAMVGLGGSQNGVQYQLYMGAMPIGGAVAGTGAAIGFGEQVAAGVYSVMATTTASCSRAMSGVATVSITPAVMPVVTMSMNTMGTTVCAGTEVTYTANTVNGGPAPVYNWMVNGSAVGAGAAAYTYTPANGDVVSVLLTSNAACATPATASTSVNMTVNPMQTPAVSITADHTGTICRGTSVTFTATAEFGGSSPVYSWMRNGVLQATGAMYTVTPNDNDVVSVQLTSNFECRTATTANSNELTSDVTDPLNPTVQITADATVMHEGQPVTFTAVLNDAGISPDVQWLINGDEVASTVSFVTSMLKDKDTVSCHVTVSSPCGEKEISATIVVNMSAVSVTGVNVSPMDVRIMPNPNNGTFVIKGSLGSTVTEDVHAEVTNMLGQVVYSENVRAVRGNIDHRVSLDGSLANGVYLLNITAGGQTQVFYVTVGK